MTSYQQPTTVASDPALPDPNQGDASMKDKATAAADQGRQAAGQVAQTAGEHVQEVKEEAAKQARDLMGEARQHVSQQVGGQHQNLVANLRSLSSELGSMADRSEQSGPATELVSQARERVNGVADWLDGREPGDLVDELRTFARRRPGTFLLGALAAGVVAGRLTRGAVAAHTDDSGDAAGPDGVTTRANGAGYAAPAFETPAYETPAYEPPAYEPTPAYEPPAYEPGAGYTPTTPQPGGYEPGYGSTSTYGDTGTSAYPAPGYENGSQR